MSSDNAIASTSKGVPAGALLIGTGLALASLILVPALAMRIGLDASVAGALRIALMKASHRFGGQSDGAGESGAVQVSCH